ncbi:class I SAM-dependent methyltransferase [uncultured Marinobacter sp.]|uniref:class I SAM-dependent methyltransferase n=1 Tax=uncultured Marinobacter sp. TaxID=187379 RepID=UPI0030D9D72B
MTALTNASQALLRNRDLLQGRVGFIGLTGPGLLAELSFSESPLVICEHAGTFARLQAADRCQPVFGYRADCPGSLDTVVLFVPKAKAALTMQLALAASLLTRGGGLVVVGEKKEGIAGAVRQLQAIAPDASKQDSARHCQVWLAHPPQTGQPFVAEQWLSWHQAEVAGTDIPVADFPGIFSAGRLDEGTRRLLATLAEQPPRGAVLDFACGSGVIGAWLQTRYPDLGPVDGVDVQAQAIDCARQTYARNSASGELVASDGLPAELGYYRSIITNPPFHTGVRTDTSMTETFLRQVRAHLLPGGELRLVANRFLPYVSLLEEGVGPVRILAEDGRFVVYQARRA